MPVENDVFVCGECGAPAIESWPFVHCYKCGNREDRPDLGLDAKGQVIQNTGTVFGGGTPDEGTVVNVPADPGDPAPVLSDSPGDPANVGDANRVADGGTDL